MASVADLAARRAQARMDSLLKVRVENSLMERLKAVEQAAKDADLKGITVSSMVRDAVEAYLDGVEEELNLSPEHGHRKAAP